jgi:hypothetical protein
MPLLDNPNEKANTNDPEPKIASETLSGKFITDSDGYKLVKKMQKEPPYLRKAAENACIGQEINWEVEYEDLDEVKDKADMVRLYLVCKEGFPWVYGEVSLKDYPWLKTLKQATKLNVTGKIISFHGHSVELANVRLKLNPYHIVF